MSDDDVVTEVVQTGWFGRLGGALLAVPVGLLLFIASFFVLFWNEGRAVDAIRALDAGLKQVVAISSQAVDPANDGKLVHVAGTATTVGALVDPAFQVGGSGLLRLERKAEMFQWREIKESKTEKSVGGGETTTTTYRYVKEWADHPIASSEFKKPEGHGNPTMPYRGATYNAPAQLGAFTLGDGQIGKLDDFRPFAPQFVGRVATPEGFHALGDYLYRGASLENPALGDMRVSFRAVPSQAVTVVAAQSGRGFSPFHGGKDYAIDLVETGMRAPDAMFADAKADENLFTWILRVAGFAMMWTGLMMIAAPISWLASVLPFLESLVDAAASLMALILALPLSLGTIAVAWLTYRPLVGGGLLLAGILGAVLMRKIAPHRQPVAGAA